MKEYPPLVRTSEMGAIVTLKNMITISNLTKTYGDFKAVDDISLDVRRGEIFAFLGPNGAGKSTTIKMLTTLLAPSSGDIMIDGHDIRTAKDEIRKAFGIVFQDPSLDDDLTAYENMDFHGMLYGIEKSVRKDKIRELLEFVELWERKDDFVKNFSGGMKRRLEIARGFLHLPKVIFLDEPTIGLDPQTRNHIWQYVKEINRKQGVTVFFTTHYMDEADKVAHRIAIMDHGKIVSIGTSEELKAQTGAKTLEEAFLALTGKNMRQETSSATDRMRQMSQRWGK